MYRSMETGKEFHEKIMKLNKCPICYCENMERNRYKDLETVDCKPGIHDSTSFGIWIYYCKNCYDYFIMID